MPARADATKKVTRITRSTSMPMKVAASRSWAVARMALPNRVRKTKASRATISATAATNSASPVSGVTTLATRRTVCGTRALLGTSTGAGLTHTWTALSRKSETPIAVMRGARRLAFLSGR